MNKRAKENAIKIGVMVACVVCFILINKAIANIRENRVTVIDDNENVCYQIEDAICEDGDLIISGWFFELESIMNKPRNIDKEAELSVFLMEVSDNQNDTENTFILSTEKEEREDVNQYFKCEYDYRNTGFKAHISLSDIDLQKTYKILIKNDVDKDEAIETDSIIECGKLLTAETLKGIPQDINGTILEDIVTNGRCLVSRPENHCFVYQKEQVIYWIAEDGFYFEPDGQTHLQYQMGTTQFDRLPKDRIDNGWFWGNEGACFEEYEIEDKTLNGKYRVCARELPNQYSLPIKQIWMGNM